MWMSLNAQGARVRERNTLASYKRMYPKRLTALLSLKYSLTCCWAHLISCGFALRLQGAVVDTTGAGDAFIGSVLYGLAMGLDRPRMLQLAATVAACKCTAIGARQGLPTASQLAKSDLLVQ